LTAIGVVLVWFEKGFVEDEHNDQYANEGTKIEIIIV